MTKKSKPNDGQAIVEFAFVLPLLLIIVLGFIEFGILFFNKAMVTNASREGARVGIELRKSGSACVAVPDSEIATAVSDYLQSKLITFGGSATPTTSVTRTGTSPDCDPGGGTVEVQVSYTHTYLAFPRLAGWDGTVDIGAETTMRRE